METSAGDSHHEKPPALSHHSWYNPRPNSVPSPPKPNQNYIVPPAPPPLRPLFPRDSTVTVTVSAATTTQPGLCPLRDTQAKVWQREEGKGDFLRHDSLGFPHRGMGVLVGAAPRPGWAVDPTEERDGRCYRGEQCWDGEVREHPLGLISAEGSSQLGALQAEPSRNAEGRRGAGHPTLLQPQFLPSTTTNPTM